MKFQANVKLVFALVIGFSLWSAVAAQPIPVDRSSYKSECGVNIYQSAHLLLINWPMDHGEQGRMALNLRPGEPLIDNLGVSMTSGSVYAPTLRNLDPVFFLNVGTRSLPSGRPPEMSIWNVFFDKVPSRPVETHKSELTKRNLTLSSEGKRATITLGDISIGQFTGNVLIHLYEGARLVHIEAVVKTSENKRAILPDMGLVSSNGAWERASWMDTSGVFQSLAINANVPAEPRKVRHRMIMVENNFGSVALMPPPHQFFDPRDFSDNLSTVWAGKGYQGLDSFSVGLRHSPSGGGNFVPWFNAPPDTDQHLGMFLVLAKYNALGAFSQALRYTHNDRFVPLPGHITYTSHFHLAHTLDAMKRKEQGTWKADWEPDFVQRFKQMGVNAVHMGEWHGDGHPKDPGPLRLPEYEAMFSECRRLSTNNFLLIPGEEINDYLGIKEPGKHPGHWMSLFPKPVYWIQLTKPRTAEQTFIEDHPKYGKVYRVGSREDMVQLLNAEGGLAWTAHPRIKASSWTPDIFRGEDFFKAPFWLGGAFKAMPGDLSREKLGERCLNLLDDMCNWGERKYLPGEVDTFKLFADHEIYGHMNINYLRLPDVPKYDEGWRPVLDTLKRGAFFTTTGEIIIRQFRVGGKESGEELVMSDGGKVEVEAELEWTFPLKFAEIISGDGSKVYRERLQLSRTGAFGKQTFRLNPELRNKKWVRFEVWDVAANGAYTQPVWIETN